MLSHPTSFPSNFWIWRPMLCTNLLISESGATKLFIHPFAWIFTLSSRILFWKWYRLLWKWTFNPNGDSHWHSLRGLGGSPHPSRMFLTPSLWNAAVSHGGRGTAASDHGCPAEGERNMKLPKMNGDQDPVQVCAAGRSGSGQDVDGDAMEFSKHGSRMLPVTYGKSLLTEDYWYDKGLPY